ncbi:unnamed protein product [Penicillium nalgiovense]|uniref:Uncharacterized protein n=1 Tax=Penicillium nalgiovense TaxID=60175 RepID=A0A9W4HJL5_PENNA|nr:unnamed protein product [Penicillium nalgiovense]CAG8001982.1 unnamed protein product [Penicillium nalgiovense]CAG8009346.1 unnamed protein product [Penicillium nalgiovense]CAG8010505.1 unnamed protein product [Penicillium nalgiovense]CAG8013719.1 unnamed protein product [Penicillium nalgiovense]
MLRSPLLGAILLLEPYVKLLEQPLAIPGSTEVSLGSVFPSFFQTEVVHVSFCCTHTSPGDSSRS